MARAPDARMEQARELFLEGKKLIEISELLKIPEGTIRSWKNRYDWDTTLNEWKKKYSDISDTLKRGKEVVDLRVENALLKRALGYEYEEVSEKYESGTLTEKKVTKKQVVPDTTAQIFWLKNRRPDKWKDKQDVQVSGELKAEKTKLDDLIKQIQGGD